MKSYQYSNLCKFFAAFLFFGYSTNNQAQNLVSSTIQVKITDVEVTGNADCDVFAGDSDFAWHFVATDNSLGYGNNNPVDVDMIGNFNYASYDGNNGPYNMTPADAQTLSDGRYDPSNGIFFDHIYCDGEVPTSILFEWRGYENDATGNYSTASTPDGSTGALSQTLPVPTSSGISNFSYTAAGSGGSCNQTYVIDVELERVDIWSAAPDSLAICQGDSVIWGGMLYSTAGTYYDTLTALSGCDSLLELQLMVNPGLTTSLSISSDQGDTICAGSVAVFTALPVNGGSGATFQWFVNGMNTGVVGSTFSTAALATDDVVLCTMLADTSCLSDSTANSNAIQVVIETCMGLNDLQETAGWQLFPNPSNGLLHLQQTEAKSAKLELYNLNGQLLQQLQILNTAVELDLRNHPQGTYILRISQDKKVMHRKIILNR